MSSIKILMLEDDMDDVTLIERVLQKDGLMFDRQCVDTRQEFIDALASFTPDIILSDHSLPQFNSYEALKICQGNRLNIPFILVTGSVSDDFAISMLSSGADDYVLKSNMARLPQVVRRAIKEAKLKLLKKHARLALRKQNAELKKTNEELDHFIYSISHNLRGPLASLAGLLNLTEHKDDRMEIASIHAMMKTSISKLDDTLHKMVTYSQNARKEIKAEKINWHELITNCVRNLTYLSEDPINMVIDINDPAPFVSDPDRLHTILTNIISNSIRFRAQHRELMIGIEIVTDSVTATLIVRDNGIGIGEKVIPLIFDMFYRGTERSQGAGLGLYIAREMIVKLQGKFHVDSTADTGTTITLTIPTIDQP